MKPVTFKGLFLAACLAMVAFGAGCWGRGYDDDGYGPSRSASIDMAWTCNGGYSCFDEGVVQVTIEIWDPWNNYTSDVSDSPSRTGYSIDGASPGPYTVQLTGYGYSTPGGRLIPIEMVVQDLQIRRGSNQFALDMQPYYGQ